MIRAMKLIFIAVVAACLPVETVTCGLRI